MIEVEYGYRKAAADDSGTSYKIMAAGAGLYGASGIGAIFSLLANSRDCIVGPFLYPACAGIGLVVYGLMRLIVKANSYDKVYRINFVKKLNYPIEQKKRISLLLFFEKHKVPTLLPVTLESHIESAQTLNFELSTNRASQTNEFIYKTV